MSYFPIFSLSSKQATIVQQEIQLLIPLLEAHPFIANPDLKPGSQRLYTPPANQDLGTRGQGTDAQKWARLDHLNRSTRPMNRAVGSGPLGGGRGMGGAGYGGSPGVKPQIPEEFKERFKDGKPPPNKFRPET